MVKHDAWFVLGNMDQVKDGISHCEMRFHSELFN